MTAEQEASPRDRTGDRAEITGPHIWRGNRGTITGRYELPTGDDGVSRWELDLDDGKGSVIAREDDLEHTGVPRPLPMANRCCGGGCGCGPAGPAAPGGAR